MPKTKIAFCIPDMIIGGVETVFISTLEELSKKQEFKIYVFTHSKQIDSHYQEWFNKHPEIIIRTIYPLSHIFEHTKKYTNFFPLKNLRKIIFSTYKRYKRNKLDIKDIDVFIDYKNASFFKELKKIKKKKITWCHGSFKFFQDSKLIDRLDQYDKLVVITAEFKQEFERTYPTQSNKIIHIYNPINISETLKKAANAPTFPGQYFCSVARLGAPKDIETIIYAFDKFWIQEHQPNIKLLLIGDGPFRQKLEKLARQLPSGKQILFMGSQPNPFGYMRNSIAHILSSKHEGFGMVLIEAAALNTLNISSNHKNGPTEILQNGNAGLLFEVGNSSALAEIMSKIYHKKINKQTMIQNSNNGIQRFSSKNITEQIIKLIKEL